MAINRKRTRPSIKLKLGKRDAWLEAIGIVLLILYWGILFRKYPALSDSISAHFDGKGNVDAFANKSSSWTVPKMATILYALMTVLALLPRYFNYGVVEITEENAEKEYRSASRSIRYLKLIVLVIFMVTSLTMIY